MSQDAPEMYPIKIEFVMGPKQMRGVLNMCNQLGYDGDYERFFVEGCLSHMKAVDACLKGHDIIARNVFTKEEKTFALWSVQETPSEEKALLN